MSKDKGEQQRTAALQEAFYESRVWSLGALSAKTGI